MARLQMCLHRALSWGWLITRGGGERGARGQSLAFLPLAREQACRAMSRFFTFLDAVWNLDSKRFLIQKQFLVFLDRGCRW